MTTRWFRQGTVSIVSGSKEVEGAATSWLSAPHKPIPGDMFLIEGVGYEIEDIIDDEHLALFSAYDGQTVAAVSYAIVRNASSTINARIAAMVAQAINQKQVQLNEFNNWLVNSEADSVTFTDTVGNTIDVWPLPRIQALAEALEKATHSDESDPIVQRIEVDASRYFSATLLDKNETYLYVTSNREPTQTLTLTLDRTAAVGSGVCVAVATGETGYLIAVTVEGETSPLAVVNDGQFVRVEMIGSDRSKQWFVTSTH